MGLSKSTLMVSLADSAKSCAVVAFQVSFSCQCDTTINIVSLSYFGALVCGYIILRHLRYKKIVDNPYISSVVLATKEADMLFAC
jgi:hypothetical protein